MPTGALPVSMGRGSPGTGGSRRQSEEEREKERERDSTWLRGAVTDWGPTAAHFPWALRGTGGTRGAELGQDAGQGAPGKRNQQLSPLRDLCGEGEAQRATATLPAGHQARDKTLGWPGKRRCCQILTQHHVRCPSCVSCSHPPLPPCWAGRTVLSVPEHPLSTALQKCPAPALPCLQGQHPAGQPCSRGAPEVLQRCCAGWAAGLPAKGQAQGCEG